MFVVISGCSGGGRSTLLAELVRRGFPVVIEAGRRLPEEERAGVEDALSRVNAEAFDRRALAMSFADYNAAIGLTFFDRGIVDAAVAITARGGAQPAAAIAHYRYDRVFIAPPEPEICENDDRRHSLETALPDFELSKGHMPTPATMAFSCPAIPLPSVRTSFCETCHPPDNSRPHRRPDRSSKSRAP